MHNILLKRFLTGPFLLTPKNHLCYSNLKLYRNKKQGITNI